MKLKDMRGNSEVKCESSLRKIERFLTGQGRGYETRMEMEMKRQSRGQTHETTQLLIQIPLRPLSLSPSEGQRSHTDKVFVIKLKKEGASLSLLLTFDCVQI